MLRPRREWPCRCRAAEQRYEVAPPQVEHAASSPGATAIIRRCLGSVGLSHLQLADGGLNHLWGRPELF